MAIDLEKGISLQVEGELGKYQSLPIEFLVKIAEALQSLILSIAKHDLPADEAIDLNNFKLEITDFQKGSAIPSFALTQRIQHVITSDLNLQRKDVADKLSTLLVISDRGTYSELRELYPQYNRRNEIVEKLYGFTSSFNNSPVSIYEKGQVSEDAEKYRPKNLNHPLEIA